MKICILEAGRPADSFQPRHGTYATMFERWLGEALPEASYTHIHVMGGATLPADPAAYDGYLITGSRAGAYEGHDWIAPLEVFLRRAAVARVPVAGVCFGHQIMAQAYGGTVRKSTGGWVIGHHLHEPTRAGAALFGRAPIPALSFHQDQVIAAPPGAVPILATDLSPNGGFRYAFPALSVQFHPEFQTDYIRDLLTVPGGIQVEPAMSEAALASLAQPLDPGRIARGFATFLRGEAPPEP